MISGNSKYDKVLRYEANFTPDENAGFSSFNSLTGGDCFHCHGGILGTDLSYKNNGLDEFPIDSGRGLVTGLKLIILNLKCLPLEILNIVPLTCMMVDSIPLIK